MRIRDLLTPERSLSILHKQSAADDCVTRLDVVVNSAIKSPNECTNRFLFSAFVAARKQYFFHYSITIFFPTIIIKTRSIFIMNAISGDAQKKSNNNLNVVRIVRSRFNTETECAAHSIDGSEKRSYIAHAHTLAASAEARREM